MFRRLSTLCNTRNLAWEQDTMNSLKIAVKKVNSEKDETGKQESKLDPVEVAEKLISIYQTKGINDSENRAYLFEAMYRYHLRAVHF